MRINGMKDVEGFIKVIDSCKGRVELVTAEGDRLNLKSKLSQYVSLEKILNDDSLKELEVIASEPEDGNKIISFFNEIALVICIGYVYNKDRNAKEVSGMDIAGLSTVLANVRLRSDVGTAVLSNAMDTNEALGAGLVEMIDSAAMENSVTPWVGANFDMSV